MSIVLQNTFGLGGGRFAVSRAAGHCVILTLMKMAAAKLENLSERMRDVDRTLLRENLKLTFEQRAHKHLRVLQMVEELRRVGKKLRQKSDGR
ncbi:MAG TPA: hypothetical protein VH330_11475 [Candidatus Udaeobacter sp.]|jgi:hypothetical protein